MQEEKEKQWEADTEEAKTMARRKGYKMFIYGKNFRKTDTMLAQFKYSGEGVTSTQQAAVIFKTSTTLGVCLPDMGEALPWEGEVTEYLVTVEVSLDGQQFTESGLQFLYKSVDPSLSEEALAELDATDAKGKAAKGKKK